MPRARCSTCCRRRGPSRRDLRKPAAAAGQPAARAPARSARPDARRPRGRSSSCVLILAQVWTEVLWFDQLGFVEVLAHRVGAPGPCCSSPGSWSWAARSSASLSVGYRSRPGLRAVDAGAGEPRPVPRDHRAAAPAGDDRRSRRARACSPGAAASQQWQTVLLWIERRARSATDDPQYGIDLGVLRVHAAGPAVRRVVPAWRSSCSPASRARRHALPVRRAAARRRRGRRARRRPRASSSSRPRPPCSCCSSRANYWLDRYSLLTKTGDRVRSGASYTDVNAVHPVQGDPRGRRDHRRGAVRRRRDPRQLAAAGDRRRADGRRGDRRRRHLPGGRPAVPGAARTQQDAEAEYIQRNIDATRDGLRPATTSRSTTYDADGHRGGRARCARTPRRPRRIRLLDPRSSARRSSSSQQNKRYYDFPDTLSVDRYEIDGESRDTVIAVRELDLDGPGRAAAQLDQRPHRLHARVRRRRRLRQHDRRPTARPTFCEGGIPSTGSAGRVRAAHLLRPEARPSTRSSVRPRAPTPWELDYPDDDGRRPGQHHLPDATRSRPARAIGNLWNKLLYALKFGSEQILFSDRVTSESQILYDRDPRDRVQKVAPYLTLDGRVYPAVVDGRVVWIVDGYTTSRPVPVLGAAVARRRDDRLADRDVGRPSRRSQPQTGQLHPQLGQGHGRRLRRRGDAVRLGRRGPDPQGLEQGRSRRRSSRCRRSAAT